jgi:hypothetical protein
MAHRLLLDQPFIPQRKLLTMKSSSVFLSVPSASGDGASLVDQRRLQVLTVLRDDLLALGIRVSAVPGDTDLRVEITHLLAIEEGPIVRSARDASRLPERPRTLVVRVSDADEQLDLVCVDGIGNVTAERQAAGRIQACLMNAPNACEAHPTG